MYLLFFIFFNERSTKFASSTRQTAYRYNQHVIRKRGPPARLTASDRPVNRKRGPSRFLWNPR